MIGVKKSIQDDDKNNKNRMKNKNNKIAVSSFMKNSNFMEMVEKSQVNDKIDKQKLYVFEK